MYYKQDVHYIFYNMCTYYIIHNALYNKQDIYLKYNF